MKLAAPVTDSVLLKPQAFGLTPPELLDQISDQEPKEADAELLCRIQIEATALSRLDGAIGPTTPYHSDLLLNPLIAELH